MPTYEYQATKADGVTETGLVFGTSLDGVARDLQTKGLTVTRIGLAAGSGDPLAGVGAVAPPRSEVPRSESPRRTESASVQIPVTEEVLEHGPPTGERSYMETSVWGPLVGGVDLTHLAFFFRQGGTMLQAGVPIGQTVNTLSGQARSPKLASILRETVGHVEAGRPMSAAFQRYPEVFSTVVISVLRAGETGGFVDSAMHTIADYLDQEVELRRLYKKVTFYPKLQLAASAVIIIGANLIIQSVAPGAKGLHSPLTTPATWVVLGPILVLLFLFSRVGLANPRVRYNWDAIVARLPYIGTTLRQVAMARFGRAFAALYASGVPIAPALRMSADACGNEYLRALIHPAPERLEGGAGVTETLRSTSAFSPIVLDMVQTGETTGDLDGMLGKMSEFYVAEAEVRQIKLGQVFGVVVALAVAIYIGYIVVTFWSEYGQGVSGQINNT